MKRQILACMLLSIVTMLVAGCTDATKGVVSGAVMVDGEPAETGWIGFSAADGSTGPVGAKIVEGQYTATLPVGNAKVEIRVPKIVGQQKLYDTPDSPVSPLMEESLPPWYNDDSELTYDIPSGESTKDFELSTKLKKRR